MVLYGLLMGGIILLGYMLRRVNVKIYIFLISTILFFLMAFKASTIGNDTPSYIDLFESIKSLTSFFESTTRYELGYVLYSKIIAEIFTEYQYLFIVTALITILCIQKFIKENSSAVWLSFYLLVSLRIYYFFLSGLRQTLAMALICLSYSFLKNSNIFKFIIIVLIASLFHYSALFFLIAYPISRIKFNRIGVLIILSVTSIGFIFFDNIIQAVFQIIPIYYSHYQGTDYFGSDNLANYMNAAVIGCFVLLAMLTNYTKADKYQQIKSEGVKNTNTDKDTLMYFMLIAFSIAVIACRASILDRFYLYFWIFSIIFVPDVLRNMENQISRFLITYLIVIFTFLYNLIILYFRPEWNSIIPYQFFWQ